MAAFGAKPPSRRWSWCEIHRKRAWADRAAADASLGRLTDRDAMEAYPCGVQAGTFHVGHKPAAIAALDRLARAAKSTPGGS